jgi:hypothetical protein
VISGYRGLLGDVISRKAARDAASTPPPRGPRAELNGRVGPSAAVEVASPDPPGDIRCQSGAPDRSEVQPSSGSPRAAQKRCFPPGTAFINRLGGSPRFK